MLFVACTVVFVAGFAYLGFFSESVRVAVDNDPGSINFVLVNEDVGASFHGQDHFLGNDFVSLINQDIDNRWQTASRSVAEAGFRNGSFDVIIFLPQEFSERILSLESFTPSQARITYEIRSGYNEWVNQAIHDQVIRILNEFNRRTIQMYFSSILGNLFEAQRNVRMMVMGQVHTHDHLLHGVQAPFSELPTAFSFVVSNAEILETQNQGWQQQQESFTERTQELLTNTSLSLLERMIDLRAYHELQQEIAQVNLGNAQQAMNNQSIHDHEHYYHLFQQLFHTSSSHHGLFRDIDENGASTGHLAVFRDEATIFSEHHIARMNEMIEVIDALEAQAEKLHQLRMNIAERYFGNSNHTPDTVHDFPEDVRNAILRLIILNDVTESLLPDAYRTVLHNQLMDFRYQDVEDILRVFATNGLISNADMTLYQRQLEIVHRYSNDLNVSLNPTREFAYITAEAISHEGYVDFTRVVSFHFDTSRSYRIRLDSSSDLTITNVDAVIQDLCTQLNQRLQSAGFPSHFLANVFWHAGELHVQFIAEEVSPEPDTEVGYVSTFADIPNASFSIPIPISIRWTLSESETQTASNTATYRWMVNNMVTRTGDIRTFIQYDALIQQALRDDLPLLLRQVQLLGQISERIILIFGYDTVNGQSVRGFHRWMNQGNNSEQNLLDIAPLESVFRQYGVNHRVDTRLNHIIESIMEQYVAQGIALYEWVSNQYEAIHETLGAAEDVGSLYGTVYRMSHISHDTFINIANELEAWHTNAIEALQQSYGSWVASCPIELMIREYSSRFAIDDNVIFYDNVVGMQLFDSMQAMMDTTSEYALSTREGAAVITSLEEQFATLSTQTTQVLGDTEDVLANLNLVVSDAITQVDENTEYSDNFNTVMENARLGGADNPQVLEFLSHPILMEGSDSEVSVRSITPYIKTLLGAFSIFLVGFFARELDKKRTIREVDKMRQTSRVWENIPLVIKVIAISLLTSTLIALFTLGIAPTGMTIPWFVFVTLFIASGITLSIFVLRQFPKFGVYLLGAVLGLYLILTPLLGVNVEPNTIVAFLFALSPLQHIEHAYELLIYSYSVHWPIYAILTSLFVCGVMLNLCVKKTNTKVGVHS